VDSTSESRGNEEPAISTSDLRHIKMQISIPRASAHGHKVFACRLLFCRGPPEAFFRAGDTPAHAIMVRQVLFNGAPIPGKFTFNDRPLPASRENLICEQARRTKSVIRLGKDEKV